MRPDGLTYVTVFNYAHYCGTRSTRKNRSHCRPSPLRRTASRPASQNLAECAGGLHGKMTTFAHYVLLMFSPFPCEVLSLGSKRREELVLLSVGYREDVQACFFCRDDGPDDGGVCGSIFGPEAAGDFLPHLHHPYIAFGQIMQLPRNVPVALVALSAAPYPRKPAGNDPPSRPTFPPSARSYRDDPAGRPGGLPDVSRRLPTRAGFVLRPSLEGGLPLFRHARRQSGVRRLKFHHQIEKGSQCIPLLLRPLRICGRCHRHLDSNTQ